MIRTSLIIGLLLQGLAGCATYTEPPNTAYSRGSYSADQRDRDKRITDTRKEQQSEFDRHQNSVQNRVLRKNAETRKSVESAFKTVGLGVALFSALQYLRR